MKLHAFIYLGLSLLFIPSGCGTDAGQKKLSPGSHGYIGLCPENPSFFQFSDGTPYIPIGINMINPSGKHRGNPDSSLYEIGQWMKNLSANGGNYVRVWLSESFWDIEDSVAGRYDEEKAGRIDRFIEMARENNLRIKITLEHFRSITMQENPQMWATKFIYHTSKGGPLDSIRQYLTSKAGQKLFLDKVDFYKKRYGSDTLFFGWELWNEMNAMKGPEDTIFFDWNIKMLEEVKNRFPENLVMQSLGSFDDERIRPVYRKMMLLPGNQVAQVHRYLDPGAPMEVCQMSMDITCSSAVEELLSYNPGKPILLAETGAVEWQHSGPSKLYPIDTAGILLHDILFAPFFSGAAGTGMSWHWESYVDRNNLWYHFKRFSEAVKGINPIKEKFIPGKSETGDLRIYVLDGQNTKLLWLRDKSSNWQTELVEGRPAAVLPKIRLSLQDIGLTDTVNSISIYDPWKDKWQSASTDQSGLTLPAFRRSLVVRIEKGHL